MRFCFRILFALSFYTITVKGQSPYAVSSIPADLKSRAGAVIRNLETNLEIKDPQNVVYRVKKSITVFNKSADAQANIQVWYDKTRTIKSIKALVFDESGKPIGKIQEKDFRDVSVADDASLFEYSRMKVFRPAITTYPFTIEYEYEIKMKQSMNLPNWTPNASPGVSLENAKLTVFCRPDLTLRYKEINFPGKAITEDTKEGKIHVWEIKNIKVFRDEPYSPDPERYLPSVKLGLNKFVYDGVSGSFENWEEHGRWVYQKLLDGRDKIPLETESKIKSMVDTIADPVMKAKKIYEFVQQKTRYVSVQVGIGGYQPIPASEVDRLGYGDCKALVNYTKGLLKTVGINSYYTIVEGGSFKKSALPDFAGMDQFNHVILCIPFKNDTAWVDCTSKTLPFGFLGDFTDDRLVLACTPEGGKLIKTPKLAPAENRQVRTALFSVDPSGNLKGEMNTVFEGMQYENRDMFINEPEKEQHKLLAKIYAINNLEVQLFKLEHDKRRRPIARESIKLNARNYASSTSEGRMFLALNAVNKLKPVKEILNRTNPVYINRGYYDRDEITYVLPDNYSIETAPKNISVVKPFGKFTMKVEIEGRNVKYTREVNLEDGTFPPETYRELVDFYQKIADADNSSISLKRI